MADPVQPMSVNQELAHLDQDIAHLDKDLANLAWLEQRTFSSASTGKNMCSSRSQSCTAEKMQCKPPTSRMLPEHSRMRKGMPADKGAATK